MAFTGVTTYSLAAKLGFANGDVILDVEGLPFTDDSDFLAVALEIYDAPTVMVTVDRNGTTSEHTFTRY
jgi:S1-C subfamily serine protease